MKVLMKEDKDYGHQGHRFTACKGECNLPDFVASSFLKSGVCELIGEKKASKKVIENKMVNPIEEDKSEDKPKEKKTRKTKAK